MLIFIPFIDVAIDIFYDWLSMTENATHDVLIELCMCLCVVK